jgi:ketosteroid isomerase-like protein
VTADRWDVLMDLYRAFNDRDLEAAVEPLAPDVDWPNATTGGRVHGRDAVRRYWQKQWREIDPRVEPLEITVDAAGRAHVRVDQLVRSLDGKILQNRQVEHVYEFEGPFISRMTIVEPEQVDEDDDE